MDTESRRSLIARTVQEMDQAVADEISEAEQEAKRYGGAGHVACDGQLISELGGHYIYTFALTEPWEPSDETPITLTAPGSKVMSGNVVTASGMSLTIGVSEMLPPDALSQVMLKDDHVQLLERLREALAHNNLDPSLIAAKAFDLIPSQNRMQREICTFPGFDPKRSQEDAIRLALGSDVTYVIGPPGTGKTATLAAIAYSCVCEGRSVLIAAHTNIAVDNAAVKLSEMSKAGDLPALADGRIIRYGTPQLESVRKNPDIFPPNIAKRIGQDLDRQRSEMRAKQSNILAQLKSMTSDKPETLWSAQRQQLVDQRQAYQVQLGPLQQSERQRVAQLDADLQRVAQSLAQAEHRGSISRAKLAELIEQQIGGQAENKQYVAKVTDLTARLAAAQQMSGPQRFFRGISIKVIAQQAAEAKQSAWETERKLERLQHDISGTHHALSEVTQDIGGIRLHQRDLIARRDAPSDVGSQLAQLSAAITDCDTKIATGDNALSRRVAEKESREGNLRNALDQLAREVAAIDDQLRELETRLLDNAQVVATTLSRVYLDAHLRERRFDVVILDEVSMAPLPAVYIATSLADHSAVAIGDPMQLAPIVNAKTDVAKRWLGRDLFAQASISLSEAARHGSRSVLLDEQFRMDSQISAIVRKYVYDGKLRDGQRNVADGDFSGVQPMPGKALVLCDTSDARPVATRPKGGSSWVNFYHALCAVALARQIVDNLRAAEESGVLPRHRVGIVTPYKKQGQLIQRLIAADGLDARVRVGTVHRFQGLEFEAIIFDAVASPGLVDKNHFISGGPHSDAQRLVNVAVTRAQHKLVIIANRDHVHSSMPQDSTLALAVAEAQQSGVIKSANVLPDFVTSAATMGTEQGVATAHLFKDLEVLDEHTFFERFLADVRAASQRIIVLSPFIRSGRTSELLPLLAAKREAGVSVVVVASKPGYGNKPVDERAVADLRRAGIEVRMSEGMHEKLAFIDDNVVYNGSLNPLSHGSTTEVMIRFTQPAIVRHLERFVGIDDRARTARRGEVVVLQIDQLPNQAYLQCGGVLHPRVGQYGVFYSCSSYPRCKGRDVDENDLASVPRLSKITCSGCRQGLMRPKVKRKNRWLECAAAEPCNYRREIDITQ